MSAARTLPRASFKAYLQPRILIMLTLGFSSGLPFLLVGNTLSYWLRDEGTTLTAIGFISWVGLAYSLKFLWAPIIDRVRAPVFGRLGRRRGWMIIAQLAIGAGLAAMGSLGTSNGLVALGALALVVAFSAATQDIVIDAWRIESAATSNELGVLSSAYQFGYRIALLATDALILILAEHTSWAFSYVLYGAAMVIGIGATLLAVEPHRADLVLDKKAGAAPLGSFRGLSDAIVGPFAAFFREHGWLAALMLGAITLYRLPDFVMGPMTNPFYHDIGLTKDVVGTVRATVGLIASFVGIAVGGFCVLRLGFLRALVIGGLFQAVSIAAFALLAYRAPDLRLFVSIMGFDSFSTSFAGVALVSYMSSLTSLGYTATQYALLASAYAFVGKLAKGPSGYIIERLRGSGGLLHAYAVYFTGAGLIGVPGIALFLLLAWFLRRSGSSPAASHRSA
ncbi:MAG: MFS transporter [Alphaproteobacteria bacterium]|nr:MFS transporter [Alphaproteobacteria bacterium]